MFEMSFKPQASQRRSDQTNLLAQTTSSRRREVISPERDTGELLNIAEDFLSDPLMRHLSNSPEYLTSYTSKV
jgi:hypothetical protein